MPQWKKTWSAVLLRSEEKGEQGKSYFGEEYF